jgi:hypothetical protein
VPSSDTRELYSVPSPDTLGLAASRHKHNGAWRCAKPWNAGSGDS